MTFRRVETDYNKKDLIRRKQIYTRSIKSK